MVICSDSLSSAWSIFTNHKLRLQAPPSSLSLTPVICFFKGSSWSSRRGASGSETALLPVWPLTPDFRYLQRPVKQTGTDTKPDLTRLEELRPNSFRRRKGGSVDGETRTGDRTYFLSEPVWSEEALLYGPVESTVQGGMCARPPLRRYHYSLSHHIQKRQTKSAWVAGSFGVIWSLQLLIHWVLE